MKRFVPILLSLAVLLPAFSGCGDQSGAAASPTPASEAGAGAALATEPLVCAVLLGIFLIEVAVTRIVSLGSIIIAALYPVGTLINLIARGANLPTIVFSTICCVIMAAMVIWLHRSNIERLKNGTEYRFGQKK